MEREWRAHKDSNLKPTDLESAALPLELYARSSKKRAGLTTGPLEIIIKN